MGAQHTPGAKENRRSDSRAGGAAREIQSEHTLTAARHGLLVCRSCQKTRATPAAFEGLSCVPEELRHRSTGELPDYGDIPEDLLQFTRATELMEGCR